MTDEDQERLQDRLSAQKSYDGIMGFSTEYGVPGAMGLATMFTGFVMPAGVVLSILAGIAVFIFAHIVVKMFFSH